MRKKTVSFVCMIVIGLLLLLAAEIKAQQSLKPPSLTTSSLALTVENLENRRSTIENRADIDATAKSDSLKYIDQAIAHLEMASSIEEKTNEVSQLLKAAPERLKILLTELKRSLSAPDNIAERSRQMDTLKVEQRLLQKEAELIQAQNRLQQWDDRLAAEKEFSNQAAAQLTGANSQRIKVENQLADLANITEKDAVNYFRKLSFEAELNKINAEIKLIELRQSRHNVIVELF
ncbi:MAG: hypothetical protein PVI00_12940, partial [Desulfobacterales bacterium]